MFADSAVPFKETHFRKTTRGRSSTFKTRFFNLFVADASAKKPEASLSNKSSYSAAAFCLTKYVIVKMFFVVLLKSDLDVQQTGLSEFGPGETI